MKDPAQDDTVGASSPDDEVTSSGASFSITSTLKLVIVVLIVTAVTMVVVEVLGGTDKFKEMIQPAGAWGPVVYILLKSLTYVIAPLSGTSLKLGAGVLFGTWHGAAYSLIGDALGGSLNYWIARTLGRAGIRRLAGKRGLRQTEKTLNRVADWRSLLLARILLSPVYDFVSYGAGLSKINYPAFLIVTICGGLAPAIFFAAVGNSAAQQYVSVGALAITGVIIAVLMVMLIVRRRRSRQDPEA